MTNKNHKDKIKQAEIEQRRKTVAVNLLSGMNYRDMAEGLSVSIGTISHDVAVILARWKRDQVTTMADFVNIELRRISIAENAIFPKVQNGEFLAIDRMLKLQDQRAKYLPLFIPEVVVAVNADDIETVRQKRWEQIIPQVAEMLKQDPGETPEPV